MEPLKEMFNRKFYDELSHEFAANDRRFDAAAFRREIMAGIEPLSLNERMRKTSVVLKKYLPEDFNKTIEIMYRVIPRMKRGYTNLLFPDFVGLYGHSHSDLSLGALRYFTGFGSSEFAIREFLKRDFEKTIKVMQNWSLDKDPHVRRLASEGSRPRLPWSFKLDEVIRNPAGTSLILENLRADPELYVRKSVANHLNDISKDNPAHMLKTVAQWDLLNPHTAWIVKHASRSLIKKGNADTLSIFAFEKNVKVTLSDIDLSSARIRLGESLAFSFSLLSRKKSVQKLVVDYVVHYRKKSGGTSPKVFKLTELSLLPGATVTIKKKQLFKDFTTRKHFKGKHKIQVQVNGKVLGEKEFTLVI